MNWELMFSGIAAGSTGLAALFSLLAVTKASKSNKIAMEQYKENVEFNKQNSRPVLDFVTKNYKVDISERMLVDWDSDTDSDNIIIPEYASNSYIELNNIGNKTARNVTVSYYYEGLNSFKELLPIVCRETNKSHTHVFFNQREDAFVFSEKIIYANGSYDLNAPNLHTRSYHERLGSIQPYNGDINSNKVFIPKLFVFFNNLFVQEIQDGKVNVELIIRVKYTDPFQNKYVQLFKIHNYIRRYKYGYNHESIIGQLIAEEIESKARDEIQQVK